MTHATNRARGLFISGATLNLDFRVTKRLLLMRYERAHKSAHKRAYTRAHEHAYKRIHKQAMFRLSQCLIKITI